MKWIGFYLCVIVLGLIALLGVFRPEAIDSTLAFLGLWFTVLLWGLQGLAVLSILAVAAILIYKLYLRNMTQKDGSYPIQRIRLGQGRTALVSPDNLVGPGIIIDRRAGTIIEMEPAAGWGTQAGIRALVEGKRTAQAIWQGDDARRNRWGAMSKPPSVTAGAAKLLGNAGKRDGWNDAPALPEMQPEPVRLLPGPVDAIRQGDQQTWIVGQSPVDGKLISFNPALHAHAGVIGNTGTGKTTSVGYLLVAQALRHGCHVVILDPEDGQDWSRFAGVAEWHDVDRDTFRDRVAAIYAEYQARGAGSKERRIVVVLEEYGSIIKKLRTVDKQAATETDMMLDELLQRGRKRNITLIFIDQYPEHWSPQVVSGTKFRAVFQLGPNQGAKVEEYHAAKLPDRGAFLVRGHEYRTWPADRQFDAVMRGVPPLNGYRVIDGDAVHGERSQSRSQGRSPEVAPPSPSYTNGTNGTPADDDPGRWRELVERWFEQHPEALTGPARGISDIARLMAREATGDAGNYENYKSMAHKLYHEYREAHGQRPPATRVWTVEDLEDLGEPLYINGERIGQDPSVTVSY